MHQNWDFTEKKEKSRVKLHFWCIPNCSNAHFWCIFEVFLCTKSVFANQIKHVVLNSFKHFSAPKMVPPRTFLDLTLFYRAKTIIAVYNQRMPIIWLPKGLNWTLQTLKFQVSDFNMLLELYKRTFCGKFTRNLWYQEHWISVSDHKIIWL